MKSPSETEEAPPMLMGPPPPVPFSGPVTYPCPDCDRVFTTPQGLSVHRARKHSGKNWNSVPRGTKLGPKGKKACPICHKRFPHRSNMRQHLRKTHGKSVKDLGLARGSWAKPKPRSAYGKNGIKPAKAQVVAEAAVPKHVMSRVVMVCPVCGTNIQAVQHAINFADSKQ